MSVITIEMLPARHGDALLVSYGPPDSRVRLLIDAGPATAWTEIRPILELATAPRPIVDLFVITHVDTDHIEGALFVLRDGGLGLEIGDVWFNDHGHLESDHRDPDRGGVQGEYLSGLLADRPWNAAWDGNSVRLWDSGRAPVLDTGEGAAAEAFTVLSPGVEQARRMARAWSTECRRAGLEIGQVDQVLERLEADARYDGERGEGDDRRRFGRDGSVPNGSSIAFLLEYGGRSVLLTGDAYAEVLTESIEGLLRERKQTKLKLDAFKLCHHGSRRNISPELLALLDCDTFLVSTNGDRFGHPDPETIELIASSAPHGSPPTVWFNYRSPTTEQYADWTRIRARYGTDGHAVVDM